RSQPARLRPPRPLRPAVPALEPPPGPGPPDRPPRRHRLGPPHRALLPAGPPRHDTSRRGKGMSAFDDYLAQLRRLDQARRGAEEAAARTASATASPGQPGQRLDERRV